MAPPDLGSQSQSEDSQPEPEQNQLEYIEEALKKLQQSTLKIKKRNDEFIKTKTMDCQTSSSFKGWKGSAIDVGVSIPIKKPPRPSKTKALLNTDVENVLRESSEIKMRMHETLRLCEESREKNQKYLEELRQESLMLSSMPLLPFGSTFSNSLKPMGKISCDFSIITLQ